MSSGFPVTGAFEMEFESWLTQAKTPDDHSDVEEDVLLISPPNHDTSDDLDHGETSTSPGEAPSPHHSPLQSKGRNRLVHRHSKTVSRFNAYRAVVRKYSRKRWYMCKKSCSPGSQTDDSGVVSPGCDASVGTLKDVMEEISDPCLSGDESPPNIQDDFVWSKRLDTDCLDHPPELTPSLQVLDALENDALGDETELTQGHGESIMEGKEKHPPLLNQDCQPSTELKNFMCKSLLKKYCKKQKHRTRCRQHSDTMQKSNMNVGSHAHTSTDVCEKGMDSSSPVLKGSKDLCAEKSGVDCESAGFVSRNGCEISASDSGAGSQSESCCEESPRHDQDNPLSSGHANVRSPKFPCDNHHFTVIPSDPSTKPSSSGSPPLVLKLKKCEKKSNEKNAPPNYIAVNTLEMSEPCDINKNTEHTDNNVFHNHSIGNYSCSEQSHAGRSKRLKTSRKNSGDCSCCLRTRSPSRRKRHPRTLSTCSDVSFPGKTSTAQTALQSKQKKFVKQSLQLSSLQTKIRTMFCYLFPRMEPVLSSISPESHQFSLVIDDVINTLQQSKNEDDVKDSEELSGELEHLTLNRDPSVQAVYDPCVTLCQSPGHCLVDFRERVVCLLKLLLPDLTLSVENNCYRSHRDLEKFLDKIIIQNKNT